MKHTDPNWGVYAWVCDACGHLASRHVATNQPGAAFTCPCGCVLPPLRKAPMTGLSREEFEKRKDSLIPAEADQ